MIYRRAGIVLAKDGMAAIAVTRDTARCFRDVVLDGLAVNTLLIHLVLFSVAVFTLDGIDLVGMGVAFDVGMTARAEETGMLRGSQVFLFVFVAAHAGLRWFCRHAAC